MALNAQQRGSGAQLWGSQLSVWTERSMQLKKAKLAFKL